MNSRHFIDISALEVLYIMRYISLYLLTYLLTNELRRDWLSKLGKRLTRYIIGYFGDDNFHRCDD